MKRLACILSIFVLFIGCSIIDDDLSACGEKYTINYEMRIVTDMEMTINEELSLEIEESMAIALKDWLGPILSGRAHDLNVNFYSLDARDILRHHWDDVIDATQKSYTLNIPREDYLHLAVVNIAENSNVSLLGEQHSATMHLEQRMGDTLLTQPTAVYTAREIMLMAQDTTRNRFDVHLYMLNNVVALVIDSLGVALPEMDVLLSGTATGFDVKDSTFTFAHPSLLRASRLSDQCYAIVGMPSRDSVNVAPMPAKAAAAAKDVLWEVRSYVTLPNGSITETVFSFHRPLEAGALEIIRVNMDENGALEPIDEEYKKEVGVSVKLDWKKGSDYEIDM